MRIDYSIGEQDYTSNTNSRGPRSSPPPSSYNYGRHEGGRDYRSGGAPRDSRDYRGSPPPYRSAMDSRDHFRLVILAL
jgi:hypothetical protein